MERSKESRQRSPEMEEPRRLMFWQEREDINLGLSCNWRYHLAQVDLYNGRKTVIIVVVLCFKCITKLLVVSEYVTDS